MYTTVSTLVVPENAIRSLNAFVTDEHDKITVFSGTKAVKNYGISVTGSGSFAKGKITGSLTTYDYKALYTVYNVPNSESTSYWFVKYIKESNSGELKKTFESSKTLTTNYEVDFQIQGNDYGISSVFITFEVIRLVENGVTKDFVVTNPSGAGATLPDGNAYPGSFKPIVPA